MKLYIIPAYGETTKNKRYFGIIEQAKKLNYEVITLNLQIKRGKVLSELIDKAVKVIGDDEDVLLLGFSMGALISYCVSTKLNVRKAILCSISPYLHNDVITLGPRFEKHLGKDLAADVKKMRYKKPKAKEVAILYGELEHPLLIKRSKSIYKKSDGVKKDIPILGTGHEMTPKYIEAIIKEIKEIKVKKKVC
jgi:predicted esterase